MPGYKLIVSASVFIITALFVLWVAFPNEVSKLMKRKRKKKEKKEDEKDWKEIALKLEKYVNYLKNEANNFERDKKIKLKEVAIEKLKNKKLQEKIRQQEDWVKNEQASKDKSSEGVNQLKKDLIKAQQDAEKEYSLKLKAERNFKELKEEFDRINEERKKMLGSTVRLEAEMETLKRELVKLRMANAELLREKESKEWVAKAEYDKLQDDLRIKEKELERAIRESSKDSDSKGPS